MNRALLSSKNNNWCTPKKFFDELDSEFHVVLDVAANEKSAKCKDFFTPEQDGLLQSWKRSDGAVFCNPPYGREIGKWVKKSWEESQLSNTTIVLLIPARTDTKYFHDYIWKRAEIRFIRGRLKFTNESGQSFDPAPFPSMLVIYNR
jgi:phage N-6-adenine-methyltransferase